MKIEKKVLFIYEENSKNVLAVFTDNPIKRANVFWFDCFSLSDGHSICSGGYLKRSNFAGVSDILPIYDYLTSLGYKINTQLKLPRQIAFSVN